MFKQSKQRSFSLNSLEISLENHKENLNPNTNPSKTHAKNKLSQVKKAKEKIQKVLNFEIQEYEHIQEKFLNKKDYLSNKEQDLVSDLIETNRLYQQEKSKKICPLEELLANPECRAGFFAEIYSEFEEILGFFPENSRENSRICDWKEQFLHFHEKKIQIFHEFFDLKLSEMQKKECKSMLKEEIQGKVMQNIEYALALEELETRLNEYRRGIDEFPQEISKFSQETQDINKESQDYSKENSKESLKEISKENSQENRLLTLRKELSEMNCSLNLQKTERNELFLNMKTCKENLQFLTSELEIGRKRRHFLQKFIREAEIQNNMKEFEENIKGCLKEKRCWFIDKSQKLFDYHGLLIGKSHRNCENFIEEQKKMIEEIKRFPEGEDKEIYGVLKEGMEKNKHFLQNLSVFFEFKQDIYRQVAYLLNNLEQKTIEFEEVSKRKDELEIEFHQKETTLYFSSKQFVRKQAEITQISSNIIKIKDFLAFSSSNTEDLNKCIAMTTEEIQSISKKRSQNQILLNGLRKEFPEENGYLIGNKVSELYGLLIQEKAFIEILKENYKREEVLDSIFKRYYAGLIRNFNLLENKEGLELDSGLSIQTNLQLFEDKIDMLRGELDRMKTENLREMCQMNGELLKQQLRIDENRQKINALDRYIANIKVENNMKTTQTTKHSEESMEIELNNSNLVYNPKDKKIIDTNKTMKQRHKSFSFANGAVENSKYGNVSIDLRLNQGFSKKRKDSLAGKHYFFQENRIKAEENRIKDEKSSFLEKSQKINNNQKSKKKSMDLLFDQEASNNNISSKSFLEKTSIDLPLQMSINYKNNNPNKYENKVKSDKEIKEKILKNGFEVYRILKNERGFVMGNEKESVQKLRLLKIDVREKKIELWKKYNLAGKEKMVLENCFLFVDIKEFDSEIIAKKVKIDGKNKGQEKVSKEIIASFVVSQLGALKFSVKNYSEGREFKAILKEVGIEKKNRKSVSGIKGMR